MLTIKAHTKRFNDLKPAVEGMSIGLNGLMVFGRVQLRTARQATVSIVIAIFEYDEALKLFCTSFLILLDGKSDTKSARSRAACVKFKI